MKVCKDHRSVTKFLPVSHIDKTYMLFFNKRKMSTINGNQASSLQTTAIKPCKVKTAAERFLEIIPRNKTDCN